MKVMYHELEKYDIQKLIFWSLEQALYQAIVVVEGEEHVVWETEKQCMRSRNLMKMREAFEPLEIEEIYLRHESPYDEMIGMSGKGESNRLEVKLGKNPYATPTWLQ